MPDDGSSTTSTRCKQLGRLYRHKKTGMIVKVVDFYQYDYISNRCYIVKIYEGSPPNKGMKNYVDISGNMLPYGVLTVKAKNNYWRRVYNNTSDYLDISRSTLYNAYEELKGTNWNYLYED